MSDAPVYWSQPNQQVVRDGEPVGIISDDPDPQTARGRKSKSKAKAPAVVDEQAPESEPASEES